MPRWVTHQQEDNNNGRILPKEWEAQPPHPAPQPGDSAMERWVPRTFGVNGQWGLLWASLVAQLVKKKKKKKKTCLQCRRPQFDSWVRKIPWRRDRLPTPAFLGFPGDSDSEESTYNVEDLFNPWIGKIPWRRAWQTTQVFLPGESPWTEKPGGL